MSPTQRSLKYLRDLQWTVEVVEKYNFFSKTRKDLFGFGDLLALRDTDADGIYLDDGPEILIVQTTTKNNMKARINKITDSPHIALVRKCGILVHVHGWYKLRGKWGVAVVDLS